MPTDEQIRSCISWLEQLRARGIIGNPLADARETTIDNAQSALSELLRYRSTVPALVEAGEDLARVSVCSASHMEYAAAWRTAKAALPDAKNDTAHSDLRTTPYEHTNTGDKE